MTTRSLKRLTLFCGAIIALSEISAVSTPMTQQQSSPSASYEDVSVSVFEPRALLAASRQIGLQFGIPVSYEDATWIFAGDLMKMGDSPVPNRARPDLIAPVLGELKFSFQVSAATFRPIETPEKVLQNLLNDYKVRKNPGEFRLVKAGDGYSIVPDRVADRNGVLVAQSSLLDLRISLPEEERNIKSTLGAIVEKISTQSGQRIGINDGAGIFRETGIRSLSDTGVPMPPELAVVRLGATNEPARDVLARALNGAHYQSGSAGGMVPKIYWSLNYDPDSKAYVLNLNAVRRLDRVAGGAVVSRDVFVSLQSENR